MLEFLKYLWRDRSGEATIPTEAIAGAGSAEAVPAKTEGPTLEQALSDLSPDIRLMPPSEGTPASSEPRLRAADGTFEAEPASEVEGETQAPQEVVEQEPPEAAGEEAPTEEDPEEPAASEEESEADALTLRMLDEEGAEVELDIHADADTRAALERLQEQADSAQATSIQLAQLQGQREEIEEDIENLDAVEEELRHDPAGFLTERIAPATRIDVALELLHDDAVYDAVSQRLDDWVTDPARRREDRADVRERRVETRDQLRTARRQRTAVKQQTRAIMGAISGLVPQGMAQEDAEAFRSDAHRDVVEYIRSNRLKGLAAEDVPKIVSRRLKLYGITVTEGGARPPAAASTEETSKRLVTSLARRKAAAATAPATTGNLPGSGSRPPKGATLDDAFAWVDQNLKI